MYIMQPADVSVFKPLKSEWKNTVRKWQMKPENINTIISKNTFFPLLEECLTLSNLPERIQNGFRSCGLYPLDPNAVNYSKCIQNKLEATTTEQQSKNDISQQDILTTQKVLRVFKDELSRYNIEVDTVINALNLCQNAMVPNETLHTKIFEV